ncbi:hypothetical protein EQ856_09600 [Enterococcus hirae]|nr:hypothetical protein [Enterococcus hirae]MBO1099994.1 hypothetical protein [Enterococcus hirae]PCE08723.1 hypothetical protein CKY13_02630 [Enterococcus hirae]PPF00014.1 hypothetical protein C4611_01990 [Enterococcus hirae]PPF02377.1 hypothetical protein C4610_01990 [Enterococcus hirae]
MNSIKLLVKKSNNKHYILCCGNCGILCFVVFEKQLKTSNRGKNTCFSTVKVVEKSPKRFFYLLIKWLNESSLIKSQRSLTLSSNESILIENDSQCMLINEVNNRENK